MYARIPEDLKQPLLTELRSLKLRSSVKHFPALLIIFSAIAGLAVFVKGYAILRLLQDYLPTEISPTTLALVVLGLTVIFTAAVLVYFLRQAYKDCSYQDCLYCSTCDAVDRYDTGHCPICQTPLTQTASFFFTTAKDEIKILERWGLHACKDNEVPN